MNCKLKFRLYAFILFINIGMFCHAYAGNRKYRIELPDSLANNITPKIEVGYHNNFGNKVTMSINIFPGDTILKINKIQWEKFDTVFNTLTPVSEILYNRSVNGEKIYWRLDVEFPYTIFFHPSDRVVVYTDKGTLSFPTTAEGILREKIKELTEAQNKLSLQREEDTERIDRYQGLWILFLILFIISMVGLVILIIVHFKSRHKLRKESEENRNNLEDLIKKNLIIEHNNLELRQTRFDTFNAICNEFYEKSGSENIKLAFYNNVKNLIFTYSELKKIEELQEYVNSYHDNIIVRIKEQLPELPDSDIVFLTYILSGLSPKAVSLLMDINVKQYYYKRSKIKELFMASDAPDKDFFVSEI